MDAGKHPEKPPVFEVSFQFGGSTLSARLAAARSWRPNRF